MKSRFKKFLLFGFFLNFLVIGVIYFLVHFSNDTKCIDVKVTSTIFSHLHYQEIKDGIKFWELKAQKAQKLQGDAERLELVKVKAVFYPQSGNPIYLEAKRGLFNIKTKDFVLKGNVHVWQPGGYTFSAPAVFHTQKKHLLYTDTPVAITGENIYLQAQKMQFLVKENRIIFSKEVKTCLYLRD